MFSPPFFLRCDVGEPSRFARFQRTDIPWSDAVNRTTEAIQSGANVVYQATFEDGPWGGRADFLIRVERPGFLGDFSYEVVETKLARSAKVRAILQLCFYSELLSK